MIKAILFDLDGTIIDSSEGITKTVQSTLRHYGIEEPDLNQLKCFIGPPMIRSFQKYYGFAPEKAEIVVKDYRASYNESGQYQSKLYPGTIEALQKLREAGFLLGIASSKPEVNCKEILRYLGALDLFDEVSGATMDGRIITKEEVLRLALERWKEVPKEQICLVGDTLFDVEGANLVGLTSIAVSFGFGDVQEMVRNGAICVCDSMEALTEYFCRQK